MNDLFSSNARGTKSCVWSFRLAVTGIALIIIGIVGARIGLMPMLAMLLISIGVLSLIIGGLTALFSLIVSRGSGGNSSVGMAWFSLALGAAAIVTTGKMMGGGSAPIHDISTDTIDPPAFVVVKELRDPDDNPAEYIAADSADIQAATYPDIQTIVIPGAAADIFENALAAADKMGWEIVASDPVTGRIEATASTPFVGFKDDVVIRVRAIDSDTHVDVRSKSRMGRGDMGVNAQRIRDYRDELLGTSND